VIHVTWEWLGQGVALDLADTVAIEDGLEHDLIATSPGYERWAAREATFLPHGSVALLKRARTELVDLRTALRDVLAAVAAHRSPPAAAVDRLNRASRSAPTWIELDALSMSARDGSSADEVDALVATFAHSAIELVATQKDRLRRCPAPSCGMFYVSTRAQQRWCSGQCGTRARVARHYRARHQRLRS